MTNEQAAAWLREQGDAVPQRTAPAVRAQRGPAVPTGKVPRTQQVPAAPEDTSMDDAARRLHRSSWLSFLDWDAMSRETRDEFRAEAGRMQPA